MGHLVKRKNDRWRACVDYCRLNQITILDQYPIPHLQDFIHHLHECTVFTTLGLTQAYYQVPVAPENKAKTTVIISFGLFQFNAMIFDLCNAAQSFQRPMDKALRGLEFCHCYIDDVLITFKNPKQYEEHL